MSDILELYDLDGTTNTIRVVKDPIPEVQTYLEAEPDSADLATVAEHEEPNQTELEQVS
jgi:hypothetical protein